MGLYLTPPGRRIAYDTNGTVVRAWQDAAASPTDATSQQIVNMNTEATHNWEGYPGLDEWGWISMVFDEPYDLAGIFVSYYENRTNPSFGALEISTDSTNGFDGTWTQLLTSMPDAIGPANYRNGITPFNGLNAVAVRFRFRNYLDGISNIHLYGKPASGATVDRIQFLDPLNAGAVFDPLKDWEEVPQGQVENMSFVAKNLSPTLTANGVDLSTISLTGASYTYFEFSTNNADFFSTVDLGNMAPLAEQTVYLRMTVPVAATLGPQVARVRAVPTSWS